MTTPYVVALQAEQPLRIQIAAGTDHFLPLVNPAFGDHTGYTFKCQVRDTEDELMFSLADSIETTDFTEPTETGLTITFPKASTADLKPGTVYYFDVLGIDGDGNVLTYYPISEISVLRRVTNPEEA